MSLNLANICQQTTQLAREVGNFIKKERHRLDESGIEEKGRNDLVTYVDKKAEKKLMEGLAAIVPEAGFITEEQHPHPTNKTFEWIIDPIDGTMNYVNRLPPYSISIALRQGEEIVLGVVFEVVMKECFYSWKGSNKAYLNGTPFQVSNAQRLADSLLATGFPYGELKDLDNYLEVFKHFMHHSQGIRRLGSAAVDLAYVACGRFGGFYEYDLKAWDVAAGSFLVQQAGGKVTDFEGKEDYIFGGQIIAACPAIHESIREVVAHYM